MQTTRIPKPACPFLARLVFPMHDLSVGGHCTGALFMRGHHGHDTSVWLASAALAAVLVLVLASPLSRARPIEKLRLVLLLPFPRERRPCAKQETTVALLFLRSCPRLAAFAASSSASSGSSTSSRQPDQGVFRDIQQSASECTESRVVWDVRANLGLACERATELPGLNHPNVSRF